MKVLITGADGQLGTALQKVLRHDVWAVGKDVLDITDWIAVQQAFVKFEPDIVINAAAYTQVDAAEENKTDAYRINAVGPRNLALASAALNIPILHVSTDYVFDGMASKPYHEYDQPSPRSVYGASKLAGEQAVRTLNPQHFIVRTAWLFDVPGNNFLKIMCGLADKPEVRVVSDQFGSPTFVPHLAIGIQELIETQAFGIFHVAGRGGASWYELTCYLYDKLGVNTPVVPVSTGEFPRPAERPRYSVLTTIQEPRIQLPPWQEGVDSFVVGLDL